VTVTVSHIIHRLYVAYLV